MLDIVSGNGIVSVTGNIPLVSYPSSAQRIRSVFALITWSDSGIFPALIRLYFVFEFCTSLKSRELKSADAIQCANQKIELTFRQAQLAPRFAAKANRRRRSPCPPIHFESRRSPVSPQL